MSNGRIPSGNRFAKRRPAVVVCIEERDRREKDKKALKRDVGFQTRRGADGQG